MGDGLRAGVSGLERVAVMVSSAMATAMGARPRSGLPGLMAPAWLRSWWRTPEAGVGLATEMRQSYRPQWQSGQGASHRQ